MSLGMDRMLICFERDATNWLRKVKNEFDSTNQQFDENFRRMFIQTSTDRLNATYSQFILESQLNKRAGIASATTNDVIRGGRSSAAAVSTPNASMTFNRAQANTIKRETTTGQMIVGDVVDSSPDIQLDMFEPYSNDKINENVIDSTVGIADDDDKDNDNEPDDVVTQQRIESKPNLAYGFRDRNSPIFARRRKAINALLQLSSRERRRRTNPTEKKFKCDQCTFTTATKSRLGVHVLAMHSAEKPFECEICKERMGYRQSLKNHSIRRHGIILLS